MESQPSNASRPSVSEVVLRTLRDLPADTKRGVRLVLVAWAMVLAVQVWDSSHRPGPQGIAEFASVVLGTAGVLLVGLTEALRRSEEPSSGTVRQILMALPTLGAIASALLASSVAILVARVWLGSSPVVLAIAIVYGAAGGLAAQGVESSPVTSTRRVFMKIRVLQASALACLLAFAACAPAPATTGTPADETALRGMAGKYADAFNNRDVATLAAMVTDDYQAVAADGTAVTSRAKYEEMEKENAAKRVGMPLKLSIQTAYVKWAGANAASLGGTWTMAGIPAGMGADKGAWTSMALKGADGQWRLATGLVAQYVAPPPAPTPAPGKGK